MTNAKVGLVLSGGGAKGAYQVGVLKALLEVNLQVDAIAGASIGALNGAILASAPSLSEGVGRMEEVWDTLATSSPLLLNTPYYLSLLVAAGLRLTPLGAVIMSQALDQGAFSDGELKRLMDQHLNIEGLNRGLSLYVSTYRSHGALHDTGRWLLAQLGIDTPDSEFFRVQDLPRSEQKNVLLASAAIPLLFALRQVNGKRYSDGGQGGWMKFQGNTPITPLLQHGCTTVIVTHLTDGSLWSRHDFPNVTVIEIRPQKSIQRENPLRDMLAFGTEHIPSWKEQGYSDALANVERIMRASTARRALRDSEQLVQQQELKARAFDEKMREAMRPIVVGADEDG